MIVFVLWLAILSTLHSRSIRVVICSTDIDTNLQEGICIAVGTVCNTSPILCEMSEWTNLNTEEGCRIRVEVVGTSYITAHIKGKFAIYRTVQHADLTNNLRIIVRGGTDSHTTNFKDLENSQRDKMSGTSE